MDEASSVWFLKYSSCSREDQCTNGAGFCPPPPSTQYTTVNSERIIVDASVKKGEECKSLSNLWSIAIAKSRWTPVSHSLRGAPSRPCELVSVALSPHAELSFLLYKKWPDFAVEQLS